MENIINNLEELKVEAEAIKNKKLDEKCQLSDMEHILRSNFDYISMYKAIQYLKPLYKNTCGWLKLAIKAWKRVGYCKIIV
jgi:hypothetical protein